MYFWHFWPFSPLTPCIAVEQSLKYFNLSGLSTRPQIHKSESVVVNGPFKGGMCGKVDCEMPTRTMPLLECFLGFALHGLCSHKSSWRRPTTRRRAEKGLADGGGWRNDILPIREIEASFVSGTAQAQPQPFFKALHLVSTQTALDDTWDERSLRFLCVPLCRGPWMQHPGAPQNWILGRREIPLHTKRLPNRTLWFLNYYW